MEEGPGQKPRYESVDEPTTHGHHNTETKGSDEEKTSNPTVRLDLVFTHLSVFGTAETSNTQETVASVLELPFRRLFRIERKQPKRQILHNIQGLIKSGELVAVLGKPGSGCSTFLKTVAGQLNGLELGENASISFSGIAQQQMRHRFREEIKYNPERDCHFQHLTVGQTLRFAAALCAPHDSLVNVSRSEFARNRVSDIMRTYELGHTEHTKVGDEFIRGVSGGERRKVSIAEMALSGCAVSCWDQSTRGLDSSSAIRFIRSLTHSAKQGLSHIVSLYQASDAVLCEFDKVIVLYEGRQVFFGSPLRAGQYFEDMGWTRPPRQPLGDFLMAVTNFQERNAKDGCSDRVPRTAEEFENQWQRSEDFRKLQLDMSEHEAAVASSEASSNLEKLFRAKRSPQTLHGSPYLTSTRTQIKYCTIRMMQRLWKDKASTLTFSAGQTVMSLILGSLFYQTPNNTDGLYSKGGVLFASILLNAVITVTEIFQLYSNRPIIEKQAAYTFYRPWTDAFASLTVYIPLRLITSSTFNIILYFLAGLRRTAAHFFTFYLFCYVMTLVMSSVFRTIGASTKAIPQAFVVVGVVLPLFVVYTGFVIPKPYMHVWFKWLTYINPVGYAFESLIANEFHDRNITCTESRIIPPYAALYNGSSVCAVRGSIENQPFVSGDAFIHANYEYSYRHIWRNLGILFGFLAFFITTYLVISDRNMYSAPTSDDLVFRRGHVPRSLLHSTEEVEMSTPSPSLQTQTGKGTPFSLLTHTKTFSWNNVCYDISVKDGTLRLLAGVTGWVKPGTLTALMGVSGAGKTTLLDILAKRDRAGFVSGAILLDGWKLPPDFERSTGYVQQQDLHVDTTTVREALRFSAMLRQASNISKQEKFAYVEKVIEMLGMTDFADAVVGVLGRGLGTRQRKLLSIGVELAAKPSILLFLDEPTTGLDSASAFGVVSFLRMLANSGTTVLCTIHQPSAVLFQQFDRLLLLVDGGRTAYFGDIGGNSQTVIEYFERNGARACTPGENPAEYVIETASHSSMDWAEVWKTSQEGRAVTAEVDRLSKATENQQTGSMESSQEQPRRSQQFALPFHQQLYHVTARVFQQYWRTPKYVWAKMLLAFVSSIFIGFTFYQTDSSIQGVQNAMFAIFMQAAIFPPLVNQIMPKFIANRELYEVRERPSKSYCWQVFLIAQVLAELPYQILMGIIVFAIWNYTVFGVLTSDRQGVVLLFLVQFFVWAGTFAHMVVSALPDAEPAAMLSILMFVLSMLFSGVLQPPNNMPSFWKFLWRVSPMTYWIAGVVSTGLHGRVVKCAAAELNTLDPPAGMTCAAYLKLYLYHAPGYLLNPNATTACEYCPLSRVDQFLAQSDIYWTDRWRNFGFGMAYICFNVAMTVALYYLIRLGTLRHVLLKLESLGKRRAP